MILAGDWVVPVSHKPISNGGVAVSPRGILSVAPLAQLKREFPSFIVVEHPGCVLTPGLVNAHTHLSLTALAGLIPPGPFHEWLPQVVKGMKSMDEDDFATSAAEGARRCLSYGVSVVGDITYGPEGAAATADAGVAGVFFWEVLGITGSELAEYLADTEFPVEGIKSVLGRTRCGISPHSPYSCGPSLYQAAYRLSREGEVAFATHVAESPAEVELVAHGGGSLSEVASRLAYGFKPSGTSPIGYLDRLGVLNDAILIHGVQVTPSDIRLMAKTVSGVVLCPRSNRYLETGLPNVERLLRGGVPLAVGTDSAASNKDLDLLAEAKALRRLAPSLTCEKTLRILTLGGAEVLGIHESFGSLEIGKQSDVIAFQTGHVTDPMEALLRDTTPPVASAVTAGVWRIRDGSPVDKDRVLRVRYEQVAQKAEAALAG